MRRKVTDSAAGGVKLDKVNPGKATDLGDRNVLAAARRRRALLDHRDRVQHEIALITLRVSWLTRKASRLPKGSNGRMKAEQHAAGLQALAMMLTQAISGSRMPKPNLTGVRHADRAIRLLHDLQTV
jgi:hypothetical protein